MVLRLQRIILALVFLAAFPSWACCEDSFPPPKEALFYKKLENENLQCQLCPHSCIIAQGKRGFCGVRVNRQGKLVTLSYGRLVSMNELDPVEKKPLFHFLPGEKTFSIATAGCNLKCVFCQNWEISQAKPDEIGFSYFSPEELIERVKASGIKIIAYTYSEPTIFYEYMIEVARLARAEGIKNVMHSNGYINPEPLSQLCAYLDAANIDVKAFTDDYYFKMSSGKLGPVLDSLKLLRAKGVHIEITALIIAGYNDDEASIRKMCIWIKENLGSRTPLHFSRAFPMYKLLSIAATPVQTLEKACRIAQESGLTYVYIGNLTPHKAENTYCPSCGKAVILRSGISLKGLYIKNGRCAFCNEVIDGIWE